MSLPINYSIPCDVLPSQRDSFMQNLQTMMRGTRRLLMFACDQKMEHLNTAFYGPGISLDDNDPEHLFRIAGQGDVGLFATHLGLIARYGLTYPDVPYLVKLNGKTNLIPTNQRDPVSDQLWSVDDVVVFRQESKLKICGVGYTLYLGSEFEHLMLAQAAQIVWQAHRNGLVAVLWIYPRGKAVINERDAQISAGAAGVGASLGADFVKINLPQASSEQETMQALTIASQAAGRTGIVIAGGTLEDEKQLLRQVDLQLKAGVAGCAIGRNIHQRSLTQAIAITRALSALIYQNMAIDKVLEMI